MAAGSEAKAGSPVGASPATERFQYQDLCEASAAVVLDNAHFAVASDDSETIAIYRRGEARPVRTVEHRGVTDIEGAARIDGTVFWMTSHSLNKDGEDKPKRKVLFAMADADGPTLADTGTSYRELRANLAAHLGLNEDAVKAWLNIEGVASTPDRALLVGLRRSPQGDRRAYVVRIDDPFGLIGATAAQSAGGAASGAAPGRVWRLDLGDRGIRSMELVGSGARAYLILAGPHDDEATDFRLFWWDGASESVTPGPNVSFGDMAPEALVAWADGQIQILGDNEGEGPGRCSEKAEDERPRSFPSLSLRLD